MEGTAFQAKRQGVEPEDPDDSPAYKVGEVIEVSDASARHFVNRGVAVVVGSKAHKAAEATASATTTEDGEAPDYEELHVDELHKLATDRNLEGRAGLNKADLIKLIEKDDKAQAKKAERATAAPPAKPSAATPPPKP